MALRPMFGGSGRPAPKLQGQNFDVEPGTIGFSRQGEEMQDYSQSRPVTAGGEIPQSLRDSSFGQGNLRPLLQGNSDGSPMSLADMESRQNAMGALDEFFTNAPDRQRLQESASEAELSKTDAMAEDPLYKERGLADLDLRRRGFELEQKARIDQDEEVGRRDAFGSEMKRLLQVAEDEMAAARSEGDTDGEAAIKDMMESQKQILREKYGIGAKLSAAGLYKSPDGT